MGRFLKALVMTLLLMEIAAIVSLTAVWTLLAEFHAPQSIQFTGLGLAAAGLVLPTVMVFRRALSAERRLESDPEGETVTWQAPVPDLAGPNAVGPATALLPSGDQLLVRGEPAVHRVI